MSKPGFWQEHATRLAERQWDTEGIRARLNTLRQNGFAVQRPDLEAMQNNRAEVLDRVQLRGEEYEYLTHSCAKGSALALMEAFGLGNWEIVRSMSPFPGFGMTGGICGGVTGGLIALGLFFGSDDPEDFRGTERTMTAARTFIALFKEELGSIMCPDLHEDVVFGKYMDPRAGRENFAEFQEARGFEKCAMPPGVGARLAADIILAGNDRGGPG
ncbi:MAG: C_GCAxxG_C_C family protein [Deltaproteobacteria bacterium]|nr:C_GCAxxG_C_C family protein [Deltaproteobacteria bacterium]